MGKQGPCYHCGTHSTPLWRNGPPEKPVLCNACGSRYRIRGSLVNYAPKHAQGHPIAKRSRISSKKAFSKLQENFSSTISHSTASDDSTTYKSSPHSEISLSPQTFYKVKEEQDSAEIQGEINGSIWKSCIPSRKRSLVVYRKLTLIEKLQKDLFNIMKREDPSMLSENEENSLIYNANNPQVSYNIEIGLGTILLKPNSTGFQGF